MHSALPRRLFAHYAGMIRRHPGAFAITLAISLVTVFGTEGGEVGGWATAAYPLAMGVAALLFDAALLLRASPASPAVEVRRPAREVLVTLVPFCLGLVWLGLAAFAPREGALARLARPPGLLLVYLLLAPVVPLVTLWRAGYRRGALGLTARGAWAAPAVIAVIALTARAVMPWALRDAWAFARTTGLPQTLALGLLVAALPEELYRFLLQSRLGALLRNPAAGWLLASFLWAFGHLPFHMKEAFLSLSGLAQGLRVSVALMPLGLLWGYLTHRSRSVLPAVLVHGTNLWGLHNV